MQQGGGYGVVARIQDGICEVTVQGRDKEEFVTSHIDELILADGTKLGRFIRKGEPDVPPTQPPAPPPPAPEPANDEEAVELPDPPLPLEVGCAVVDLNQNNRKGASDKSRRGSRSSSRATRASSPCRRNPWGHPREPGKRGGPTCRRRRRRRPGHEFDEAAAVAAPAPAAPAPGSPPAAFPPTAGPAHRRCGGPAAAAGRRGGAAAGRRPAVLGSPRRSRRAAGRPRGAGRRDPAAGRRRRRARRSAHGRRPRGYCLGEDAARLVSGRARPAETTRAARASAVHAAAHGFARARPPPGRGAPGRARPEAPPGLLQGRKPPVLTGAGARARGRSRPSRRRPRPRHPGEEAARLVRGRVGRQRTTRALRAQVCGGPCSRGPGLSFRFRPGRDQGRARRGPEGRGRPEVAGEPQNHARRSPRRRQAPQGAAAPRPPASTTRRRRGLDHRRGSATRRTELEDLAQDSDMFTKARGRVVSGGPL